MRLLHIPTATEHVWYGDSTMFDSLNQSEIFQVCMVSGRAITNLRSVRLKGDAHIHSGELLTTDNLLQNLPCWLYARQYEFVKY